jgi:hypothetical protein
MSTKPTTIPRWAATAPGTVTGTIVEPSSDKKTKGFVVRERPPSQFLDWLFYIIYTWIQYLADGALSGDHTIDGTLKVGGQSLTFTSFTFTLTDPDADGILTMHAVAHGRSTGDGPVRPSNSGGALPSPLSAGTDYWITRLGPDDLILSTSLEAALLANNPIIFTSSGSGTQSVNATGGTQSVKDATVTSNLIVEGRVTQATETISVPLGAPASLAAPANDEVQITGGTNGWRVTLPALTVGRTITAIRAQIRDNATGPTTVRAQLYSSAYDPISDSVGTTVKATTNTSSGAATEQLLVATGLSVKVAALTTYHIIVEYVAGSGTVKIHHVNFDVV